MAKRYTIQAIIPALLSLFLFQVISAQSSVTQIWYTYNHQAIVSKHWGYMFDINHRTGNFKGYNALLSAARIGGTYLFDMNHRVSAGYAWFGTHLKDEPVDVLDENRLWQQYHVFGKKRFFQFFHRVRVEERWREQVPINGYGKGKRYFTVRPRYMFQMQGTISNSKKLQALKLGWQGATEIMFHAGEGIGQHYFDQWRMVGGPVILAGNISLAILYQYINQYRVQVEKHQSIHSLRLTLLHNIDFRNENEH